MTPANLPWPELVLEPDTTIAESEVFRALRTVQIELMEKDTRQYVLVCTENVLKFEVGLTGILSDYRDTNDPYRPNDALAQLRQTLNKTNGAALEAFLRYSPWLVTSLKVKDGGLSLVQQGMMLTRLLDLIVMLMETENLTAGQWRNVYHLLLRVRFLVLARLSQTELREESLKYLRDLDFQAQEAWQTWGQAILQAPQEMSLLLARFQRRMEEEGNLLLFSPETEQIWNFVRSEAARPFVERLLTGWFLPRYDLGGVTMALTPGQATPSQMSLRDRLAANLYRVPLKFRVGLYIVIMGFLAVPLLFPVSQIWQPSFFETWWPSMGYAWWWGAVGLTLITVGLQLMLGVQSIRYTFPRITLAIMVGFLALVSSGELMTFAIRAYDQPWPVAGTTVLGSIFLAFLAIYLGVRRHVDDGRVAFRRAGLVWLIAATRSLTLGWLILAPAGSLLLYGTEVVKTIQYQWAGPLGLAIYPQLIFVLTPLALFIGIFVQTIWEEYPLTHPI